MNRTSLSIAAIQMVSGPEVQRNLAQAEGLIKQASEQGAECVVLPENFAVLEGPALRTVAEQEQESPMILPWLQRMARQYQLWLVGGTIPMAYRPDGESVPDGRVRAACCLFSDAGELVARYDKVHLFDVEVGDQQGAYQESARIEPGSEVVVAETPWGKLGLAVCYDLRFAEIFLAFAHQGCQIIVLPAAFTHKTGEAHWNTLVRARAIETQSLMVACNQGGQHSPNRKTWGHTQIVDAWGTVLNELAMGPGVVMASVDLTRIQEIRKSMPLASHRVFS